MEIKHTSDFENYHIIGYSGKYFKLGFGVGLDGEIYPTPMEELLSDDLPLEIQVEWGIITQAQKMEIEAEQYLAIKTLYAKQKKIENVAKFCYKFIKSKRFCFKLSRLLFFILDNLMKKLMFRIRNKEGEEK